MVSIRRGEHRAAERERERENKCRDVRVGV